MHIVCVNACMCVCVSACELVYVRLKKFQAHAVVLGVWNLFLSLARLSLCKQPVNGIEFSFSPMTRCLVKEPQPGRET